MRIVTRDNRVITRRDLFKQKEEFHKKQAKLPFSKKVKILIQLQMIANSIKGNFKKTGKVWFQSKNK